MSSPISFSDLPKQIRLDIWRLALADKEPRVHTLGAWVNFDISEGRFEPASPVAAFSIAASSTLWESTLTPRQIASVCSESRKVALAFFPDSIEFRHPFADELGILRFNGAQDIISLEFQGHLLSSKPKHLRQSLEPIKHLALNLEEMESRDLAIVECFPALQTLSLVDPSQPTVPGAANDNKDEENSASGIKFLVSELQPKTYLHLGQSTDSNAAYWNESRRRITEAEIYLETGANEILRRVQVRFLTTD